MVDVVVSRYKEDFAWIKKISKFVDRIFLYNKSGLSIPDRWNTANSRIIDLENIGRESDTILYHIIANYDDLADITIFSQGNPFDHCPNMLELIEASQHGMAAIQEQNERYMQTIGLPHPYWTEDMVALGRTWKFRTSEMPNWDRYNWLHTMFKICKALYGKAALPKEAEALWGAQFAITRANLQRFSLETYKQFRAIHNENYFSPWGIEKYWLYLYTTSQEDYDKADKLNGFMF